MGVYYVLFGYVIIAGLIQYCFFRNNKLAKMIYLAVAGVFMIYLVGSRYGRGFDYFVYIDLQHTLPSMSWTEVMNYPMEPGFMIYAKLISMVSSNPHMLYYVTGFVVVGIACYLYYRYSLVPFLSLIFFMATNIYFNTMNSIRYALAIAIVMLLYPFIMKTKWDYTKENMKWSVLKVDLVKNFLPYLLITLLAASFHKSALIMIPIYFMLKIPLTWITGGCYAAATAILFFFGQKITFTLSDLFFNGNYSTATVYTTPGRSFHFVGPFILCVAIAMVTPRILKKYKGSLALINLTIFSLILFVTTAFSVFIFSRLAYYTYAFITFLIPMAIDSVRPTEEQKEELARLEEELKNEDFEGEERHEAFARKKKLVEEMKDEKAYYIFGIAFALAMGLLNQYRNYINGSHDVFPYMSMSNNVNMFTNFIDENDTAARANYMSEQLNMGRYLKAANDPNYVIIIAGQGDLYTENPLYRPAYTYAYLEPLEYFGLDTRLAEQYGQSYVAIGEKGNAYYNELSTESIETTQEIDGHTIEVSSNHAGYSSIKIDGEEYSNQLDGLNIVIYDKKAGEVVDVVTCDVSQYTLRESVNSTTNERGYILKRRAKYAQSGYDMDSIQNRNTQS